MYAPQHGRGQSIENNQLLHVAEGYSNQIQPCKFEVGQP